MRDVLNEDTLRAALGACGKELALCVMPVCPSTNAEAKRRLAEGETRKMLIVAEEQTAGSGRMGRRFYSPKGTGVYFSLLLPEGCCEGASPALTSKTAVAAMRGIRCATGLQTDIKWVNDLQLRGKKICGILAEGVIGGSCCGGRIIGIGINLRPCRFPAELADIAGSLADKATERCALIAAVIRELLPLLSDAMSDAWLEDYRRHSCVLGREITWTRGAEQGSGIAASINADGSLTVRCADGSTVCLGSGEISLRVQA